MLAEGTIIGETYRVESVLGEGGMGSVHVAVHVRLGKRVAIKTLARALLADDQARSRFSREALAATRVRHPGIVEVLDVGEHEGVPWIAMELLEGESLRHRLTRLGRLEERDAVRIVREALSALAAVHEAGIVHRDLKPDNLFLERIGESERVKILDFGIARPVALADGPTRTGAAMGTAHYLAPEQARDAKSVDARADVYAMGAVLYECLAGRPPFEAESFGELVAKLFTEEPAPLAELRPDVSPTIAATVRRALARDPSDRPRDARALRAALDATNDSPAIPHTAAREGAPLASTVAIPAAAPTAIAPAPRTRRGRRTLALLGCVALPVLALVGGAALFAIDRSASSASDGSPVFPSVLGAPLSTTAGPMLLFDTDGDGIEELLSIEYDRRGNRLAGQRLCAQRIDGGSARWCARWDRPRWSVGTSPTQFIAVHDDLVLWVPDAYSGWVRALDAGSGNVRWTSSELGELRRLCTAHGQLVAIKLVDGRDERLRLDWRTGQLRAADGEHACESMRSTFEADVELRHVVGGWQSSERSMLARRYSAPYEEEVFDSLAHHAQPFELDLLRRAGLDRYGMARVDGEHTSWIRDLPPAPNVMAIESGLILVGSSESTDAPVARLTAIEWTDGSVRWERTLPGFTQVTQARVGSQRVVADLLRHDPDPNEPSTTRVVLAADRGETLGELAPPPAD